MGNLIFCIFYLSCRYKSATMYLSDCEAKSLYYEIKDTQIWAKTVVESFSPSQNFSNIELKMECKAAILLDNLMHFESSILVNPSEYEPERRASEMLLDVIRSKIIIDTDTAYERNLVLELMVKVIKYLTTCSMLESRHKSYVKARQEVEGTNLGIIVKPLGIGSKERGKETWYGSPDGRTRGVSPGVCDSSSSEVNVIGFDERPPETDGCSSNIEFKLRVRKLSQKFATAVVGSFTENNLHPNLNSLVPTLVFSESYIIR